MFGLPLPPNADPYLTKLVKLLNTEFRRLEPEILGYRHDGTTLHLRFRAPVGCQYIQVHVQSTAAGEGGSEYDASNYTSTTEVDCRANRVQDVTVTDVPSERFVVYLIPVEYDGSGAKVLWDGVSADDHMSFSTLGL